MSFQFVSLPYNSAIDVSADGSRAVREGFVSDGVIVYMQQTLEVGNELVLHVEDGTPVSRSQISLTLGVTTCCPQRVMKFACHATHECEPSAPCKGSSTTMPLKQCSEPGSRIIIRRVPNHKQITVCVGDWCGAMFNMDFKTMHRLFPFVMLTGDVSAIRIGSESIRQTYVSSNLTRDVSAPSAIKEEAIADMGCAFLIPPRPERKEAGKYRTTLKGNMHGVGNRMIFLSRDLSPGLPLTLRVVEKKTSGLDYAFIFGVTTCDRSSFGSRHAHKFVYTDPGTCAGHSKFCRLPDLSTGDIVTIERTEKHFIRFAMGDVMYELEDPESFFKGKKTFPFVMITGTVFALEIINLASHVPPVNAIPTLSESVNGGNPTGYSFLAAQFRDSVEIPRKRISGPMHGIRFKMTFLDRELAVGKPLIIRITRKKVEQDIAFTFGVTTCNRTARHLPFEHVFNFLKPSTCRGHEKHCEIPSQPLNALVLFERTMERFIKIKTEKETYFLTDNAAIFRNKKAFPYVMVNGSAYALEIVNEDEAPAAFVSHETHTKAYEPQAASPAINESNQVVNCQNSTAASTFSSASSELTSAGDCEPVKSKGSSIVTIPSEASKSGTRKWFSNVAVTCKNSKMVRTEDPDSNSCIFCDQFASGDEIRFQVMKVITKFTGSIAFGVTRMPLVLIDIDAVPKGSDDDWSISPDILPVISLGDEICIKRLDSAVVMRAGDGEEFTLFALPSKFKVFPFFRFDGAINELRIIDQ